MNTNIGKNVCMLYIRILINMILGLYSSRIILNALGISDYGIFNVVCGIVVLFSFFNDSMSAATQRFINFSLGEKKKDEICSIFSTSIILHIGISILLFTVSETIGLYMVNQVIEIPIERTYAANFIYQISILCTIISIIKVPFNAVIIAYEKMSFYAYISIFETSFKLINIIALLYIKTDKLILYSLMLLCSGIITFLIYIIYIKRTIPTLKFTRHVEFVFFKKLTSFSGWTILGSIANVGAAQGVGLIINHFYGVIVNAAIGVANNVNGVIYQFVTNLQLAFNPQTIQSYSQKNTEKLKHLIFSNSKYSFYLLYIIGLPIILHINYILKLWLGEAAPIDADIFVKYIIFASFFDAICGSLWTTIQATGRIKNYQIIISLIIISVVPISYLFLFLGYQPIIVYQVNIIMRICITIYRSYYLKKLNILTIKDIYINIFRPIILTIIISLPLCILIDNIIFNNTFYHLLVAIACEILTIGIITISIGTNKNEKSIILNKIQKYIKRNER